MTRGHLAVPQYINLTGYTAKGFAQSGVWINDYCGFYLLLSIFTLLFWKLTLSAVCYTRDYRERIYYSLDNGTEMRAVEDMDIDCTMNGNEVMRMIYKWITCCY